MYDIQFEKILGAFPNSGKGIGELSLADHVPTSCRYDLDIWDAATREKRLETLDSFCEGREAKPKPLTVVNQNGTFQVKSKFFSTPKMKL